LIDAAKYGLMHIVQRLMVAGGIVNINEQDEKVITIMNMITWNL
jgi:hypothetical protein